MLTGDYPLPPNNLATLPTPTPDGEANSSPIDPKVVALAGGVGGAKLAYGLYHQLGAYELAITVNTGDDEEMYGLRVCPDLDTVMYTLAGLADPQTGWGLVADTFAALEMLGRYGRETWFKLGDKDLATHILRTEMLRQGLSLTEVTASLARALGVQAQILPMCNERVETRVETSAGELAFQDYFVRRRSQDPVRAIRWRGLDAARPTPQVLGALRSAQAVVVCPSNPIVSIGPILAVPGVRQELRELEVPKVAVSPIVGRRAVSGPAGAMLAGLGYQISAFAVAQLYADFLTGFVIDNADHAEVRGIQELGLRVLVTNAIMKSAEDKRRLAGQVLEFALGREG